jgi:copper chaperone CopZ
VLNALRKVPGVACVQVDVSEGLASIRGSARTEALSAAVESAGFSTRPAPGTDRTDRKETSVAASSCDGPTCAEAPASFLVPPRSEAPPATAPRSAPALAGLGNLADNRTVLEVKGMSCGACVAAIERLLLSQAGVHQASVALLTERAEVSE